MMCLNQTASIDMGFVTCKTKKKISIAFPGEPEIIILEGSQILVDPEEGIGLVADSYFEILPEEYTLLYS